MPSSERPRDTIGTFRKNWRGGQDWADRHVGVSNVAKIADLLGQNAAVYDAALSQIERLKAAIGGVRGQFSINTWERVLRMRFGVTRTVHVATGCLSPGKSARNTVIPSALSIGADAAAAAPVQVRIDRVYTKRAME
ncbi:MAG TPA: hypothetical protein VHY76_06965 [Acetobacteraceae bacterium]|nr:hypothetical protein [Acetobacteraceae bacterium]